MPLSTPRAAIAAWAASILLAVEPLSFALCAVSTDPAAATGPGASKASAALDAYVKPFVDAGHLAGQVVVSQNGKILIDRCYGLADRELAVPVTPDTRFCIASITKPITIIVATELIQEGKLAMADTIGKWIRIPLRGPHHGRDAPSPPGRHSPPHDR
ncbi:MAG: serine hydrolase domain-containing protein [Candidatus Eiseniibacteriota bacterium]